MSFNKTKLSRGFLVINKTETMFACSKFNNTNLIRGFLVISLNKTKLNEVSMLYVLLNQN